MTNKLLVSLKKAGRAERGHGRAQWHNSQGMKEQVIPKPETILQKEAFKEKPHCVLRMFHVCREMFAREK